MGTRMSTRREVAQQAGVSVTTVSNVLNRSKMTTPEVESRVLQAVKDLNYHPNLVAKGLKTSNSMQIGVIISEINNPYFVDVLQGIEAEAALQGYSVSIFLIKGNIWLKYKDIMGRRFAGVINISNIPYTQELVESMLDSGAKLMNFDEDNSSNVGFDARPAMADLMERVKQLGHRKVSYVVGLPAGIAEQDERVRFFSQRYEELGFEDHPFKLIYGDFPKSSSEANGISAVETAFSGGCESTAMFCINDMCALGVIKALSGLRLRVPEDVSVIGCDNIGISELVLPSLTTVQVPRHEIGRRMMQELVRLIDGGEFQRVNLFGSAKFRESLGKRKER